MDYVCGQATTTPWLRSFLGDLFSAFTAEVREMDRFLRESFGVCSNFQELAQKFRHSGDEVGMVHAMLLYAVRAALLLECVFFLSQIRTLTSGTRVSLLLLTYIAKDRKPRAAVAQPWRRQTRNTPDRHLWRSVERRFRTDFGKLQHTVRHLYRGRPGVRTTLQPHTGPIKSDGRCPWNMGLGCCRRSGRGARENT